jgi:O-succinylhomoserine sulfhydrylase
LAGLLKTGDHILVSQSVFGSTVQIVTQLLPRWGITYDFVEINSEQDWESKRKKNTRLFFLETPSNPGLDLADLGSVSGFCKKNNLLLLVDNCFATPYLQKPVEYGADLVIHSATKWIDGQGRVLGGAVVGPKDLIKDLRFFARHTGPALSPFNAWVLSKSLETLAVRMDRHCQNALEVAQFLEENSAVEWVKYPFLPSHPQYDLARKQLKLGGGIVCFALKGGQERVFKMVEQVDWFSYTANLGDTRTILTHPASTTHSKLTEEARLKVGITPGLVRLSVGLEAVEDIKRELERILRLAQG